MRNALWMVAGLLGGMQTAGAQDLVERAVARWKAVLTVRATFEQTVTNPLTGSSYFARGSLQQRKPDRLAITFSEPSGDRIVADGRFVWVFLQSATPGQVIKLSYAAAGASNTDLIGQFLDDPRSKYEITDGGPEVVDGRATHSFVLVGKPGRVLPFIRAKVWLDTTDAVIRQFESTETTGVTRKVRLLTMLPNATVDSEAFTFRVPSDVRVVEPRR